ncbi:enzymatic polyprotein-related [Holotrichia oblita]|uniref:Enzymatic polyprotein-related n=1 Tax=Holotrichia oblita TaxID=644536 RepID=A0ACB9TM44_HOLOL|nr:enzymatic polyprotein-related [Holotrichia oblita]
MKTFLTTDLKSRLNYNKSAKIGYRYLLPIRRYLEKSVNVKYCDESWAVLDLHLQVPHSAPRCDSSGNFKQLRCSYVKSSSLSKSTNVQLVQDKHSINRECYTPPLRSLIDTIERLENLIEELIQNRPTQSKVYVKPECIPEFSPGNPNLTAECTEKIEQLALINHWNESAMIFHTQGHLGGLARKSYDNLPSYQMTWRVWNKLLLKTFTEHQDFATVLRKLLQRVKIPNESWKQYYFYKLVSAGDIIGKEAVSCLIDGIRDLSMQAGVRAGRYPSPDTMYAEY